MLAHLHALHRAHLLARQTGPLSVPPHRARSSAAMAGSGQTDWDEYHSRWEGMWADNLQPGQVGRSILRFCCSAGHPGARGA
jgi:hypothetical protein